MTSQEWRILFKNNLKRIMIERHFNAALLSEYSGLSESSISKYLHGTRIPTALNLVKLAQVMQVDVRDLLYFDTCGLYEQIIDYDDYNYDEFRDNTSKLRDQPFLTLQNTW